MSAAAQLATANILPVQAGLRDARAQDDGAADTGAAFESLLDGAEGEVARSGGDRFGLRSDAASAGPREADAGTESDRDVDAVAVNSPSQPMPLFAYTLVSLAMTPAPVPDQPENAPTPSLPQDLTGDLLRGRVMPQMPAPTEAAAPVPTEADTPPMPSLPNEPVKAAAEKPDTMIIPVEATASPVPTAEPVLKAATETAATTTTASATLTVSAPEAEADAPSLDAAREALSLLTSRPARSEAKAPVLRATAATAPASEPVVFDFAQQRESMSLKVVRQETHLAISTPGAAGLEQLLAANRTGNAAPVGPKADVLTDETGGGIVVSAEGDAKGLLAQPVPSDASAGGRGGLNFAGQGGADTGERSARGDASPSVDSGAQASMAAVSAAPTSTPRIAEAAQAPDVADAPSPATQVADRIATAISSGEVSDTSTGGAVRVLHIELKPHNLGTVTVRVSLKDNAVTMHIEAQRHETASAIERERDALSTALKQAGYVVDGITAQTVDRPRTDTSVSSTGASGSMQGSDRQTAGQSDQGFSNPGQRGSGQREAYSEQRGTSGRGVNDSQERSSRERTGALYV